MEHAGTLDLHRAMSQLWSARAFSLMGGQFDAQGLVMQHTSFSLRSTLVLCREYLDTPHMVEAG